MNSPSSELQAVDHTSAVTQTAMPAATPAISTAVDLKKLAMMPTAQIEAVMHTALEDAFNIGQSDPLAGLDAVLQILLAGNVELLRNYMPALVSAAQATSQEVAFSGRKLNITQAEARGLTSMHKLQGATIKLGAARVKVAEELARRRMMGG